MWPGALPLIALLATLLHPARCSQQGKVNFREKEKQVLDNILGPGRYDARIRPSGINGTDGPAIVRINLFVRSIMTISDNKMEYSVQLTFREQWLDERLKFNDFGGRLKYLTLTEANKIWMPDLFFSNEKEGHLHNIIMPNVYIRIFPEGSVLYSIRISLTLSCPMNLKLYPLDRQICSLRMASYGWTTDDLVFLWKEGDPVQVVKNLHLPRFTLEKFLTDYCNSKTNTGEYSCLKVDLYFKREFSYYLIQIYIPCCMLVIVSWVSFWLDQSAVPARVSLGVTTLLTMATQTSGINASLPPVSYTKAIDIWTGVCLTFVFGALLEFALVNYASRSDMHRENMKKQYREMEHSASVDPSTELLEADGPTNFAMVVAVQVPDKIQANRRHCTNPLSSGVRLFQSRLLVNVPVPGGGGGRLSLDEEALGSRDVARGHLNHSHAQNRSSPHQKNFHQHQQRPQEDESDQHYHYHHHHHHHHRHHHHHPRQHQSHQSLLHYRRDARSHSPSSPSDSLRGRSPRRKTSRIRSSSLTSKRSTPSPTPTASPAQTSSPSPPTLLKGEELNRFQRLPSEEKEDDRCFLSFWPRGKLFRCYADGSARIDVCSRICFPLVFVVFNIGYWSAYLFPHDEYSGMNKQG
ncbi:glutamate-gated chloride channel isoform X5 [Belonocnema kinseyi]|uniref:glutamate-gated chloride channel isoform X5 n=1 Tax=Belonocnema kinseyi TaxID=2817044 RepID=UPI00143D2968|nr:glutamate-gated chloride channel isoform X5 [Belonocnema kinseyi]